MPKRIDLTPEPSDTLTAALSTPAPGPDAPSDSFASSTAGPAGEATREALSEESKPAAPKVKSLDGHDLLAKLKATTTANVRLINQAQHYVEVYAVSAPGDRLAANVAKELKRVRKLPEPEAK